MSGNEREGHVHAGDFPCTTDYRQCDTRQKHKGTIDSISERSLLAEHERRQSVDQYTSRTNRYVISCCLFASLGGILFGYDQGVISIIITLEPFFKRFPALAPGSDHADFYKGLMTAMIELGALIGAFNQGWIADKYSRRKSIMFAVVIFGAGSIMQTAAGSYPVLVVGRFVGGIGIGMLSMVAPLYMAEIAPADIRGSLLVMEEWCIVFGIVLAYWITYGTRFIGNGYSEWTFRLPFLLQVLPALILGAGSVLLPYSPRWLALQQRNQEGLVVLARIRNSTIDDPIVLDEWFLIEADATFEREVRAADDNSRDATSAITVRGELRGYRRLFRRAYWRRTIVGLGLQAGGQWSAINALIYYAPLVFSSVGLSYESGLIMGGVMNMMQLIGVSLSIPLIDRVGRRPLLIYGALGMCVCHTLVAAMVGLYGDSWTQHHAAGWVGVAFILVFMIAYGISWGPIPWSMPSEIFPSSLRAKGTALSTCSNWLNNFIIGLITPAMFSGIGYGTYVFFASMCMLAAMWTYFFVPETKGATLEQMDAVFGDRTGLEDEIRKKDILLSLRRAHRRPAES